jgi:uncharacterized RDD family membrane protein YckC
LVATYVLGLLVLPIAFVYWVLCHKLLGQTPGKWLLGIRVENAAGGKLDWKAAVVRTLAFAWGPLAWSVLAGAVYLLHGKQAIAFQLAKLSLSELAVPIVYLALATAILVGYMAGFLLVAFHPKRQSLHDLLAKTLVYIKPRAPAGNVVDVVKSTAGLNLSRHY